MTKPKGLFILEPSSFEMIYGPDERRDIHALVDIPDRAFSAKEIAGCANMLREADVIFSGWGAPRLDAEFLDMAPDLKAFFYGAGSVKYILTDEFWQRNIAITSAVTANAIPVAEYAHAQIILSLKRVWWFMRETHRLGAYPASPLEILGAYDSTVGLLSLGTIGRMVCKRLAQSNVHLIAYDPLIPPEQARALNVELVSKEELFQRSDVISIHTPWLKETEGMVNRRLLRMMKKGAVLINTARGALINEPDLIEVLQSRPDLMALLDVTHPEPPQKGSPFYSLPNVLLTPHLAGSVNRECRRMGRLMVEEVRRFLEGRPLRWQLTRDRSLISA